MSNRWRLTDFAALVYLTPDRHIRPVCIGPTVVEQIDENWTEELLDLDLPEQPAPGLWIITGRQQAHFGGWPEVSLEDGGGEVDIYYIETVWRRPSAVELIRLRRGEPLVVPDITGDEER